MFILPRFWSIPGNFWPILHYKNLLCPSFMSIFVSLEFISYQNCTYQSSFSAIDVHKIEPKCIIGCHKIEKEKRNLVGWMVVQKSASYPSLIWWRLEMCHLAFYINIFDIKTRKIGYGNFVINNTLLLGCQMINKTGNEGCVSFSKALKSSRLIRGLQK